VVPILRASAIADKNTVLTIVTLLPVSERGVMAISEEYFAGILGYKSAMAQARLMLSKGIISEDEYAIIDTMMAEKYGLCSCSLFRENDLLCGGTRGNMSHYEEVTKCQE